MKSKLLQWGIKMAKKIVAKAAQAMRDLLRVELVPVFEDPIVSKKRIDEVRELTTRLYVMAHKRGRPRKEDQEEAKYAA